MRTPLAIAAALVICSAVSAVDTPAPAPAQAAAPAVAAAPATPPPSKESIDKLLAVMNVEKLIAGLQSQVEGAMKNGIDQTLRGQQLTPDQQQVADALRAKVSTSIIAEMSWDKLQPIYEQVYSETFTQEEIDGLTAFYQSAAGRAFVAKVPQAMRKTMNLIQTRVTPVLRNLQQSVTTTAQQIAEMKAKNAAAVAAAATAAPTPVAAPTAVPAVKPSTP